MSTQAPTVYVVGFAWGIVYVMPHTPKHGTRTEYQRHGCRCDLCREAERKYNQKRREDNPQIHLQDLERSRRYSKRHPARRKSSWEASVKRNPEKRKAGDKRRADRFRLKMYQLSIAEHDRLLVEQDGKCAICRETDNRALSVDHEHRTNRVRGLLCRRCNMGLGCFGDDPAVVATAMQYLQMSTQAPTV